MIQRHLKNILIILSFKKTQIILYINIYKGKIKLYYVYGCILSKENYENKTKVVILIKLGLWSVLMGRAGWGFLGKSAFEIVFPDF